MGSNSSRDAITLLGRKLKRLVQACATKAKSKPIRKWARRCGIVTCLLLPTILVGLYFLMFVRVTNAGLSFANELRIPDELIGIASDGNTVYRLSVAEGKTEFRAGQQTKTAGVNGSYLGPTLRLRRGDDVELLVENQLDEETTMHWHGMHVPARMDGTPHQNIPPGNSWTASFEVDQQAATLWYHPHTHGNTGRQAYQGIAGLMIIDDENSDTLNLPSAYGIDDIPLIIQDRLIDEDGQFQFAINRGAVYGDEILVNGTWNPYVSVEARIVRFRILNASNARIYYIGFEDNREFHQIATDGGFLEKPFATNRVVLAPGERAEILVDFSDGNDVVLKSFPESGLLQSIESFFDGIGTGHLNLVQVKPKKAQTPSLKIPTELNQIVRLDEKDADVVRPMALGGMVTAGPRNRRARGFGNGPPINGKLMDMHRIDEVVRVGNTEIWDLTNRTGIPHPFHLHLVQFQVLDRNGNAPIGAERGWKDTILVHPGDRVRIIMPFLRYADPQTPYMYHCHIMEHEDRGMMGQFLVVQEPPQLHVTNGKAAVVIFIAGFTCEHCVSQVQLFDQELAAAGIPLVVVTPESQPDAAMVDSIDAVVVSDPDKEWAGWLGLIHDGPAHGTHVLDRNGNVIWSDDSDTPFMDIDSIVQRIKDSESE